MRGALGSHGERAALGVYRRRGFRLIARNWRCRLGELDLVLRRDGVLVFCEVKTRRGDGLGGPHDAVTWTKQRKVRALAEAFIAERGLDAPAFRFDVASVTMSRRGRPTVHIFEDAF